MNFQTVRERIDIRKAKVAAQQKQIDKQKKIEFSDFLIDMKRNPMIMIGLGGSAFLTALSGLFIGLAPRIDANGVLILFGGVPGTAAVVIGVFFGLLYASVFLLSVNGTYWHKKASVQDEGNTQQMLIGYSMMVIAFGFMVTTAVAASVILASLLHTFSAFQAIPDWAQKWTILIIPISLAMHAAANIWYDHVSKYAEERREMERGLQTTEIEAENRIRQARISAREKMAMAMADEYVAISSQEAQQAGLTLARDTWKSDRKAFTGDEDGDGIPNVADNDYRPAPPPTVVNKKPVLQQPEPIGFSGNGGHGVNP
jgi:hypothetical protein